MSNNRNARKTDNTHQKSIHCYNIYEQRKSHRPTFTFQSLPHCSTAQESKAINVNSKSPRNKIIHTKIAKENSTQTSKTILQLAEREKRNISPDSLSGGSPRTTQCCTSDHVIKDSRQAQELYCLNSPLTQLFLERNRNKTGLVPCFIKSKSFINHQQAYGDVNFKSAILPDTTFLTKRRNSTLMQPTTSFRIKSQMEDVQSVSKLIPQVRRGRSTSPKPFSHKLESSQKIPYIDQCQSEVSSSTTLINTTRHPNRLQELFKENLLKTNVNMIELKLSELSLDKSQSSTVENTISLPISRLRDPDWLVLNFIL